MIVPAAASASRAAVLDRLGDAAAEAGLGLERTVPEVGLGTIDLPPGESVGELRADLAAGGVEAIVEPNVRLELRAAADPALTTADPDAPNGDIFQWNLRRSGFVRAWTRSDGSRASVAVIDTGSEAAHPDLGPAIAHAFDHDSTLLHGGADRDENGHGTHVAGLACGEGGNGYGIAGGGYGCELLVYKTDLTVASIAESIVDASEREVDVINMSFGGDEESKALERAVKLAAERDVVLVAAASNEDTTDQGFPASYLQPPGSAPNLDRGTGLVVTAAQYDGARAWFAPGRGNGISLAAYGSAGPQNRGIFSSFPEATTELETVELCATCRGALQGDSRFAYLEGTSMATPQVSGAAALIRSRRPRMRAARVIRLLKLHASRQDGFSTELGWGVLNANGALRAALKKKRP